jgi:hypothetical protein
MLLAGWLICCHPVGHVGPSSSDPRSGDRACPVRGNLIFSRIDLTNRRFTHGFMRLGPSDEPSTTASLDPNKSSN